MAVRMPPEAMLEGLETASTGIDELDLAIE